MKGRLIRDSIDTYNYTDFVYDDNDNVVQAKEVTLAWGTTTKTSIKTASYNSDINPYNSLGLTLYFIRNYSAELLSKHTRTKVIYEQKNFSPRTGVYTYEYENGLPKKMTVTWDYEYPYLETVDFYYN